MCEICRHSPCDARCPNADPPKVFVFGRCEQCGAFLWNDETYFKDKFDNLYCSEKCVMDKYGIKECEYDERD